jgi:hypothetical protein
MMEIFQRIIGSIMAFLRRRDDARMLSRLNVNVRRLQCILEVVQSVLTTMGMHLLEGEN